MIDYPSEPTYTHWPVEFFVPTKQKNQLRSSYKTKIVDGRVLEVRTEMKNKRLYKYLDCLFQISTLFKKNVTSFQH